MNRALSIPTLHALGSAAALALLALVFFLGLKPLAQRHLHLAAANRELAQLLTDTDARRARISAAAKGLSDARSAIDAAPIRLRPIADLNQQVQDLTLLAAQHHLRLTQITPGQPTLGSRAASVPITLGGSGHFPDLIRALRALHTNHPDLVLTAYRLAADPASAPAADSPESQFTLELSWFAASNAQANPTTASAAPSP
jgi:hypothetical protein